MRPPSTLNIQDIRRAFKELDDPWLARSEVRASLSGSSTVVRHGLSYIPQHWLVVDQDANAQVWRASVSSADSVTLATSAPVNVTLIFW
jgi:hypothetical protein